MNKTAESLLTLSQFWCIRYYLSLISCLWR